MNNLPMIPIQGAPKLPEVHFKLITSPTPHGIQQRVKMLDEPSPNLSGSDPFRRGRIGTDRFFNRWKLWR